VPERSHDARDAFGPDGAGTSGVPEPAEGAPARHRVHLDRESAERGLASLVLTIVELLRQLMERQALRRVDQGDLSEAQVERIGTTLMALEERMTELREHFGLRPEDLNLDLGPLGPLLPRD
jgi:Gas vesicle protein K